MPIGKNAIKRVENNGYSKVKTTAPDMINSTVIGGTDPQVMNMVEKSVAKKTTATKKVSATKKAPVKALFLLPSRSEDFIAVRLHPTYRTSSILDGFHLSLCHQAKLHYRR